MVEEGTSGGALQPAIAFVEVASREPMVAEGDLDRGGVRGAGRSVVVQIGRAHV